MPMLPFKLLLTAGMALCLAACGTPPAAPAANPAAPVQVVASVQPDTPPAPDTLAPADTFPLNLLTGRISPATDTAFRKIPQQYTSKTGIYLRREALDAFEKMHAAAAQEGVNLTIISAFRSFGDQKGIWENKWNGKTLVGGKNLAQSTPEPKARALAILTYSSMPATSRHHWGTDIDLNSLENSYFASGTGKKIYDWLTAHAAEYGFCQPYTAKGESRPEGYNEEKWHWSYMPLAARYLRAYERQVQYRDISGFAGSESAPLIPVIEKYVLGIAPPCRNW